jgi:tetratricopeptide (TPR) repeat protein
MILRKLLPLTLVALTAVLPSCSSQTTAEERDRQVSIYTETCAAYLGMGEYERAQDQALRGLALDDENFMLRLYLGRALLKRGDIDSIMKAEYTLDQLETDGDFRVPLSRAEVLERKGLAYEETAELVQSGERYTDAADPVARAEELRVISRKSFEGSLEYFLEALDLQPSDTEILNGLVRVTALMGRFDDSLEWGKAVVRITTEDRIFWQAQRERVNISPEEERRMTKNIEGLHALEMAVHLHAATLYSTRLDQPLKALAELDVIVSFDPSVAQVHSQRGQLLADLERHEDAIAALDQFLRLTEDSFSDPDVQRAFRLRSECETALVRAGN